MGLCLCVQDGEGSGAGQQLLLQVPQEQNFAKEELPVGLVSHCWWQGWSQDWDGVQESREGTCGTAGL